MKAEVIYRGKAYAFEPVAGVGGWGYHPIPEGELAGCGSGLRALIGKVVCLSGGGSMWGQYWLCKLKSVTVEPFTCQGETVSALRIELEAGGKVDELPVHNPIIGSWKISKLVHVPTVNHTVSCKLCGKSKTVMIYESESWEFCEPFCLERIGWGYQTFPYTCQTCNNKRKAESKRIRNSRQRAKL